MNNRKYVAWLYAQLPTLVSAGVLAPDVAERLRQHYGAVEGQTGRRWAVVLCTLLGAVFIGGGVLLVLAHNWEALSRPVRAALALALLLSAQALAGWVLWRRPTSTAWREGAGTWLTLAVGASLALVAQTYHLGGSLGAFMLTWVLLGLPVAYLLQATVPALLYIGGITLWASTVQRHSWQALGYWPLLLAVLPYLWLVARTNHYHARPVLICWLLGFTLPLGLGLSVHRVLHGPALWLLMYSALAGVMYHLGRRWWAEALTAWQRPWQTLGGMGLLGLALAFSFVTLWDILLRETWWRPPAETPWPAWLAQGMVLVWPVAAVALWLESLRRRDTLAIVLGAIPVVILSGYVLMAGSQTSLWSALLCNVYLLVLGVSLLATGLRGQRLGTVNVGMLVIATLILCRFFDADLSFVARGVAFIVLGLGFLMTNVLLLLGKGARA
jgi:uncharacterized membrane protein